MIASLYFNWVDVGVALVVVAFIAIGARQGLVRQAILVGAVYIATVLAAQYQLPVADALEQFAPESDPFARSFTAFALLFFVSLVALNWLSYATYGNTRLPFLRVADSTGGAALGLLSGWLVACLIVFIVTYGLRADWASVDPTLSVARYQMSRSFIVPVIYAYLPVFASVLYPSLPDGLPSLFAF
ncbi:MAG: CvpA family protein [Chloroflexi bacterium]|nr:CvpA family protein [Chloroflexota bacterium]